MKANINKKLAGCIILDTEGRILLLHRNTTMCKQWEMPGGKIEPNETSRETAMREAKEELGVDINIIKPLGANKFIEENETMGYSWFLVEVKSGTPKIIETATFDDLRFFSIAELSKTPIDCSANIKNFLNTYRSKKNIAL